MTDEQVRRRFDEHSKRGAPSEPAWVVKPGSITDRNARSIHHRHTVVDVLDSKRVLVPGSTNAKLGDRVVKGHWSGGRIYHLTLEERATCPRTCHRWFDCYGNNMHLARRHRHGAQLEVVLPAEVRHLVRQLGARLLVVRLHTLGDFYSQAYVRLWGDLLTQWPTLRVFGYTAHRISADGGEVGRALLAVRRAHPGRFEIRESRDAASLADAVVDEHGIIETLVPVAVTLAKDQPPPPGAIVCPAQTGQSKCCGTCALCWGTDRPIVFKLHGARTSGATRESREQAAALRDRVRNAHDAGAHGVTAVARAVGVDYMVARRALLRLGLPTDARPPKKGRPPSTGGRKMPVVFIEDKVDDTRAAVRVERAPPLLKPEALAAARAYVDDLVRAESGGEEANGDDEGRLGAMSLDILLSWYEANVKKGGAS